MRAFVPRNGVHKLAGQRGDSAQALQKIQDHALAGKNHARVVPDHGDRLAVVQAHAIENFGMAGDLVVRDHGAIQRGIHVENARHAADPGQNAILLREDGAGGALAGIDAGIAGGIAGRAVFEQRVLENRGNPSAVPVHSLPDYDHVGQRACNCSAEHSSAVDVSSAARPNSSSLLCVFSRSTAIPAPALRMPSTTFAGALARNCSLLNWRWPLPISFSILLQFFLQALALGSHVNLLLVNHVDIESRGGASAGQLRQRILDESDALDVGQPLDRTAILFNQRPDLRPPECRPGSALSASAPLSTRPADCAR